MMTFAVEHLPTICIADRLYTCDVMGEDVTQSAVEYDSSQAL